MKTLHHIGHECIAVKVTPQQHYSLKGTLGRHYRVEIQAVATSFVFLSGQFVRKLEGRGIVNGYL